MTLLDLARDYFAIKFLRDENGWPFRCGKDDDDSKLELQVRG